MFSYGINFIRKSDVLEIEPKATTLSTQDYLSYFYYSGLWWVTYICMHVCMYCKYVYKQDNIIVTSTVFSLT